jgi:CubicO group peptidase (beta-lactamase class C family)
MAALRLLGGLAAACCIAVSANALDLPKAGNPAEVGFSADRLQRLADVVGAEVSKGALPGAVMLIVRNGKVAHLGAIGFQDREERIAMKPDAIFRIASMTKPIVSVAIMMLVEEGKILIDNPVSVYLPEFKVVKVGVEKIDPASGQSSLSLEAPRREITVHDLLRHTSGLTYGIFGKSLVKQAYLDAKVGDPGDTLAQFVTKLTQLPLAYQPGSTWDYSVSTDVLGRVVEVVSGMELDKFIATRITKPLAIPDTGFHVLQQDVGRLAEPQVDAATGKRPAMRDVVKQPKLLSGGGGMVSTAMDYARFSQMLLNGGELDGVRILAPKTVAYMTSDHLPAGIGFDPYAVQNMGALAPMPERGQGFGLGFAVRKDLGRNPLPGSPGEFYWVGATGTAFWVDPSEKLVAVWMIQVPLSNGRYYRGLFRNLVYQAMTN